MTSPRPQTSEFNEKLDNSNAGVPTFPEGGLQGWLAAFGCVMVGLAVVGNLQSFGVYQDFYTLNFLDNYTPSQISWIGSLQICIVYCVGPFTGRLFDRGYFHHLMAFGSIIFLLSSFLLSLAKRNQYYQVMLAQGVGMGIGMGILFIPSLSILSHYFLRRRSMAMGIVVTSGAFGGIIYPILLNKLFNESAGFPWGVRSVAFMDLAFMVIANLCMKTRLPVTTKPFDVKQIARDGAYWIMVFGLFLGFWGIFIPFFYLQLFASLQNISPAFLVYTIPIMNAGAAFGRFFPNFVADKYGPVNVLIPSAIISAGIVWALLSVSTVGRVVAFGLLYGFFSGSFITVVTPAIASTSTPLLSDVGTRMGIACFFWGIALLTGSPIAGALLSPPHYLWWRPLAFASITILTGSVFIIIARQRLAQRKGKSLV